MGFGIDENKSKWEIAAEIHQLGQEKVLKNKREKVGDKWNGYRTHEEIQVQLRAGISFAGERLLPLSIREVDYFETKDAATAYNKCVDKEKDWKICNLCKHMNPKKDGSRGMVKLLACVNHEEGCIFRLMIEQNRSGKWSFSKVHELNHTCSTFGEEVNVGNGRDDEVVFVDDDDDDDVIIID
jgi:hypothetical protein